MITTEILNKKNSFQPLFIPPTKISTQKDYAENFIITANENNETVYQWIDTSIEQLSDVKLLNILRLTKIEDCQLESDFIKGIKQELNKRNNHNNWAMPA